MHAPGHLRDAFEVALGGYLYGNDSGLDGFFFDAATQCLWDNMGDDGRLRWIAGQLWNCTDIMPRGLCSEVSELDEERFMPQGSTYAQAARVIRQQ
jgi:hypothetical protein